MNLHLQSLGNITIAAFRPKKFAQPSKYLTIIFLALWGGIGVNSAYAQPCFNTAINTNTALGATQPQYGTTVFLNNDAFLDYAVATSGVTSPGGVAANAISIFLGDGTGHFTTTSVPVGTTPVTVVTADFNKDGIADFAVNNSGSSNLTILMGNGSAGVWNGTFSTYTMPLTATQQTLATGDFNGDTYPDIVVPCSGTNGLVVYVNTGAGAPPTTNPFTVGNELTNVANSAQIPAQGTSSLPRAIVVGDFNGDSKPDFAVSYQSSGSNVQVFLNASATYPGSAAQTTFAAQTIFADGGNQPLGMATADLNGDGILDIVASNDNTTANVSILLGNGNGTFTAANPGTIATPFLTTGIAIFDYNGDGKPDLVTANQSAVSPGTNAVSVFQGNGDGTFKAAVSFTVPCGATAGNGPYSVSVGDFNNDGEPDIISANFTNPGSVSVLLNTTTRSTQTISGNCIGSIVAGGTVRHNGNGVFHDVVPTAGCDKTITTTQTVNTVTTTQSVNICAPSTITVGTTTHNTTGTYKDITGTNVNGCNNVTVTNLKVFFGSGATSFTSASPATIAVGKNPQYATTADFNKDGNLDYAVANSNSASVSVFLGNGTGAFTSTFTFTVGNGPVSVISGDFNNDGIMDLATDNSSDHTVTILTGGGTGGVWNANFSNTTLTLPGTSGAQSLAAADLNGDGWLDLIVPNNGAATASIFLNNGAGVFPGTQTSNVVTAQTTSRAIATGDFNNDGNQDFALTFQSGASNNLQIFLGNGDGTFVTGITYTVGSNPFSIVCADFNGDGRPDLATANNGGSNVSVLIGYGNGTFKAPVSYAAGSGASGIACADFNGDGILDLATSNQSTTTVSKLRGVGDGTFITTDAASTVGSGPYSVVAGDFNNDGKPDIIAANYGTVGVLGTSSVLINTQTTSIGSLVTASATTPVCQNGTITLTGGKSGFANYSWTGPNSFNSNFQSTSITNISALAAGTYTLTAGIASGCSASATATVVVNTPASATASAPAAVCLTTPLNLTGGPSGQTSYLWKGPNSFTSSSSTSSNAELGATTASAGVYTLIVTATNTCTSSATTSTVTVNTPASGTQNFNRCAGQTVTVGGHTHTATGTYKDVTGTDVNGCSTTETTNLKVFYGNGGNGVFSTATITPGTGPQYGTVADFNGDGNSDYAVANSTTSPGSVSVFKGDGLGGFTAFPGSPFSVGAGTSPVTVISADFNKDGIMDLATNNNGTSATILMGNGTAGVWNGTFTSFTITLPSGNQTLISGDFNNDGYPDLAIPQNAGTDALSICINTAAGAAPTVDPFTASPTSSVIMTLTAARGITAGDFNNDGNLDLAVSNQSSGSNMQVFLGNGFGGFTAQTAFANGGNGTLSLTNYDFNGDGNLDLASASYNTFNVDIQFGNGSGGFGASTSYLVGSSGTAATGPSSIAVADVNGDAIPDIITANAGSSNGGTNISVILGNGTGGFGSNTTYTTTGSGPYSATVGDFNNDGKLDVIAANYSGNNATVFLNTAGALTATASAPTFICPGATLNLTGGPSGFGYSWTGPNSFNSAVQNASITNVTAAASGTYTLTVVVSTGCSVTATTPNVTVNPVVATASANTPVCSNSSLNLTGGPSGDTYSWTGPNGFSSTLQNPNVSNLTMANNGTYTLVVTATGGCTSTANTGAISVLTAPAIRSQTVSRCAPYTLTVGTAVHTISGTYLDRKIGAAPNGCDSTILSKLTVIYGTTLTPVNLTPEPNLTGLSAPQYATVADFNKDGKPDYAVANSTANTVSIFFGNGDGTFNTTTPVSVGSTPVTVISADFNKDGIMDLATDNSGNGSATILMGNGSGGVWNGTFSLFTVTLPSGNQTLTSGDFNNDGYPDLAIPQNNNSGTALSICMNTAAGAAPTVDPFAGTPTSTVTMGLSSARGIACADFNGDGNLDLAICQQNINSPNVQLFLGNGQGGFTPQTAFADGGGTGALDLVAADFDGNGTMDIAIANSASNNVSVYMGNGSGGFTAATGQPFSVGGGPSGIACADFNGDGIPDLGTSNAGISNVGTNLSILTGNGSGGFSSLSNFTTGSGPYSIAVGDFNNDSKPDIVTANYTAGNGNVYLNNISLSSASANTPVCNGGTTSSTLTLTGPAGLTAYSWKGPNSFTSTLQSPAITNPATTAAGIYTLTISYGIGCTASATTAPVVVNNSPVTNQTINQCTSFVVGSTRHNTSGNYTDILTAHDGCDSTIHTNLTINAKTTTQSFTKCIGQTVTVGSHTYNESGTYVDHFTAHNGCDSAVTTSLTILFGGAAAPATVSNTATLSTGTGPQYGTTADFDKDGNIDYAVANSITGTVSLFLGNGNGGFHQATGSPFLVGGSSSSSPITVISGDFNKDGIIDLATNNSGTDNVTLLMGNGSAGVWDGTFTLFTLTLSGSSQQTIASGDFNGDGYTDLAVPCNTSNTMRIFLNTAAGAAPTTNPFPATSNSAIPLSTAVTGPANSPRAVAVADYNGDGNLDLAVSFQSTGINVQVLLGNGIGGFTTLAAFTSGGVGDIDLTSGDFNNDGKADLAVANANSGTVSVMFGNGSGGFTLNSSPAVGSSPTGVTYVDFNGDGIGDLVVANSGAAGAGSLSVLLGNSTGGFTATTALNGGNNPYVATIGDFNNDGKPDIAAADFGTGSGNGTTATILINTTSLTSGVSANTPVCAGNPLSLTAERSGLASYSWSGPNGFNSTIQNASIANPTTSASGVYTLKVTDSHGCTSSASTPAVVVNPVFATSQTITACGQFAVGSFIHTATGTYTDVIGSAHGCDSTVTTHLTITSSTTISQSVALCAGQNVTVGSETHTGEGIYTDRITHSNTCDSVITTNLKVLFGSGAASFSTASPITSGANPQLGTSADFNGDSKMDYAVANSTANTVSVFLGNGNGTFQARVDYPVGTTPVQVISGDFNNDGITDLATNNSGSNDETVLLGKGDGTFRAVGMSASGANPQYGAVGDFNRDGKLDYAVANNGANSVSIFINNGDGTFKAHVDKAVGAGPVMVISGDFNGDGFLDLATDNSNAPAGTAVSVLLGNGDGTFQNHVDFAVSVGGTQGITSGDYNGDGKLDIAASNYNASGGTTVSVLLNNAVSPALGFAGFVDYQTGSTGPRGIITADFNGDGKPDLAVANQTGGNISVLLNNAASPGTFLSGVNYGTGSGCLSITSGDFNRDGIPDLAGGNENASTVSIYLGNGDGTFTAAVPATLNVGSGATGGLTGIVSADVNLDGKPDLITANNGQPAFAGNSVSVLLGNGSGGFATPVNYQVGVAPYGVSTGDFNGDGIPDITSVNYNSSNVYVLPGKGDGTFISYQVGSTPQSLATADFNNDGIADLAVSNFGSASESILLGYGNGTFKSKVDYTVNASPRQVITGDFNGDGKIDVAIANQAASNNISILKGNRDGTFQTPVSTFSTPGVPIGITSADFNGDGKQDLVVATQNTTVSYFQNNGTPPVLSFAAATPLPAGSNTTGITSTDYNGDGNADIAVGNFGTNNVSILLGNGSGGFQSHTDISVGTGPYSVTNGDFNGDGKPDIAAANYTSGNVSILLNTTATVPAPATAGSTSPVCPNGTLNLIGGAAGLVSYIWSGPNGFIDSTQSPTLNNPTSAGAGIYSVTVTDSRGCSGTASTPVTLKPLPPLAVSPASAVCTGNVSQVLTASGASTYTWAPTANLTPSAGTGATETAQISLLTFYTVTGTGSNSCSTTVVVPVATVATGGTISPLFSIICSGSTKTLTVVGAAGHDYIWQISSDNATWDTIPGATNTTYTTASGDGNTNKFYRLLARSNSCWNVASTTAEVDVSHPVITVTASSITDNTLILNWSPTGTGNYNITYSGASSGLQTGVTPPKAITGLTANGTYSIVVTQTGVSGCAATGTLTGVTTLCAVPTNLTATPLTVGVTQELNVSWNGPVGNYRVFYRPLYSAVTFYTKDVTNATSTILTKQGNNNLYGSNTYQIYVSRLDCPNTGNVGQPTSSIYVTTNPTTVAGCASPVIDTVFSTCPVELEVQLHGGSGIYNVYIQRLTPTLQAVNSYGITGGDFVINAAAGQQYLISADSKCGSVVSTLNIWHNTLTVKPTCTSPSNLVLSNPTCHGFTASWNADQCISNTVSGYDFYMRQVGSINYNAYSVPLPPAGIGPHLIIAISGPGKNIQSFVQSIYSCGGAVTYGPSSQTVSILTLSAGCRDEETPELQETKPAVQQYSADNQEVFSLYPNPNTGEFTVDLSRLSNNTDEVRIEVINMIGQTVITQITSISDGHMSQFINLPNGTVAGTYIVRLTAGKNVYTAKINVSK